MGIQVLPPSLADKIAAGEVVERPASVVKELVENSLDAGAKNITVEIKRGGVAFIRVTDDGCGMSPQDAKLAFLRHATSKISTDEDLSQIRTYGFRGEALAAICAVSKVELITCTDSTKSAFYMTLEGGEITEEDEIGAGVGTTMIVRELFFNTPARLHFLKKDSTEAAAVAMAMERIAVGRYDVSFTLISDGKTVFQTVGSRDMKHAIHAIYGYNISKYLMPIDFDYKNMHIEGYLCRSSIMRSNRNMQLTYVNNRFVRSKVIYAGIDDAYRTSRETGKHAVCFLKIYMDEACVDVNVHPQKMEVKFQDDRSVIVLVKYGLTTQLTTNDVFAPDPFFSYFAYEALEPTKQGVLDTEQSVVGEEKIGKITTSDDDAALMGEELYRDQIEKHGKLSAEFQPLFGYFMEPSETRDDPPPEEPERTPLADILEFVQKQEKGYVLPPEMKVLGEIFKVYIVIEYKDDLYLVDKHAAHEKVIYNELLREAANRTNIPVQALLHPIEIPLSAEDMDLALNNITTFIKAGFDFVEISADCIELRTVPAVLPAETFTDAFTEALETVRKTKKLTITERQERVLKTVACRSAIKGGTSCTVEELMPIVIELLTGDDVNFCPHGRPTICKLTHKDIDKMFKRIK